MTDGRKPPIKVGLVGCGAQSKWHALVLRRMPDLKLTAICDAEQKTVSQAAKEWEIDHYYTNFREMLDNEGLSLVTITTPPQSHISLIIEAIERHVNLFVEKPLATSTNEASSILKSLERNPIKLTVNYNMLLNRSILRALSEITTGTIGDVLAMDVVMLATGDDRMTTNQTHWTHKLAGGRLGEMISHPVYLAQAILGNDLKISRSSLENEAAFPG